jgi:hypothetical protein
MKNIHIISTDKPSRLFEIDGHLIINREQLIQPKYYRNIYITSDEEIKEGYYLDLTHNIVMQSVFYPSSDKNCKKIILTTDQNLIKDGVQAIDDEFLEWFVKNPSCEEVKLESELRAFDIKHNEVNYEYEIGAYTRFFYKIIIPKEEPKQETLEEFAEREASEFYEKGSVAWNKFRQLIEVGGKWQKEQDKNKYSDGEVLKILYDFSIKSYSPIEKDDILMWFKQFKKK